MVLRFAYFGEAPIRHRDPELRFPCPAIEGVAELAAGTNHTCALSEDGSVWCWGRNELGQVGVALEDASGPARPTCPGGPCWPTPALLERLPEAVQIAASRSESCALTRSGDVYCWGAYDPGDIAEGTGGPEPRLVEPTWADARP